jgi:hypothetical protein
MHSLRHYEVRLRRSRRLRYAIPRRVVKLIALVGLVVFVLAVAQKALN